MAVEDEPVGVVPRPRPSSASALSVRGMLMLERFEGFRGSWYGDVTGVGTIGFGHTGPLPEGFSAPLTGAEGVRLLLHDLQGYERAVRALDVHLTQPQFDALCDFAYNCGPGALQGQIRTALHAGRYALVPELLGEWVHAGGQVVAGLVTRRRAEGELFAHGVYPSA